MARIIYKEGCEGQNTLESIEGIEIELLNGQKALIYPKYAQLPLLAEKNIESWDAKSVSEIEALKKDENLWATGVLLKRGSPAAEFVSNFRSDKHSIFGLPTLLAAMEIQGQKEDIDALAKTIEDADLLRDTNSDVWSCSRSGRTQGWFVNGYYGDLYRCDVWCSFLAVPVILY